jgi:probable addiction module antidote protein
MAKKSVRAIHNKHLRDPEVAAEYLNEAFASGDNTIVLMALRNIVEAQEGGIAKVAERAELGRQSMYKTLSETGNPKLDTLTALFHGIGLQISVKPEGGHIS